MDAEFPSSNYAPRYAKPRAKGFNNITLQVDQTASEFGIERLPPTDHCPIRLTLANSPKGAIGPINAIAIVIAMRK